MAYNADNSANSELLPPHIEPATREQLSSLCAQAKSLYLKAQDPECRILFGDTTVTFDAEDNTATYRNGRYTATGQYRELSIQLQPYNSAFFIIETVSFPCETGRVMATRAMEIDAFGNNHGSDQDVWEEDKSGFTHSSSYEGHTMVPKDYADTAQDLIDTLWAPKEPTTSQKFWRRILTS